jgi:K+-sensing histidine kinase KdpD
MRSVMVVPLIARGALLGAITFVSTSLIRQYDEAALALAKDLASRAALAVDNARLYTESRRTQEQLRNANETKDEFLGLVSHELRTPITTIYGGARLLRLRGKSLDETSRAEVLRDIGDETDRLHRIVENLLVLARAEVGPDTVWEPMLLQRVIEGVARSFQDRFPLRTVKLTSAPALPAVAAEVTYLEQVMRNLLSNAEKYSPPGTDISITIEAGDGEAIVRVLDRGPGIAEDESEAIFDRFYRSAGTQRKTGIGLGLTVCKRLVEAQSGRIWACPRDGGGLEVAFSVPYAEEGETYDGGTTDSRS